MSVSADCAPPVPSLWDFACAHYALPGVADACLALQDQHRAEVPLLLWLLWRAARACPLAPGELARVRAQAAPWQQTVVEPLRKVRRALKGEAWQADTAAQQLREQVRAVELASERWLLEQLALWGAGGLTASATLEDYLQPYWRTLGLPAETWDGWCQRLNPEGAINPHSAAG